MSNYQNNAQSAHRLRTMRKLQQTISNRIQAVQKQLKEIENYPTKQNWVSFKRIQTIADLKSPHLSLKDALNNDLHVLRTQMKTLKGEVRKLEHMAKYQHAKQASTDLRKRLDEFLKRSVKQGFLEEGELNGLLKDSQGVIRKFLQLLETNPSLKTIGAVLGEMEIQYVLGGDVNSGTYLNTWRSLSRASQKLQDKAESNFRRSPSMSNFDKLIHAKQSSMQLGINITLNAKPSGWHGAKPGTFHIVARGDSLSEISKSYYGNRGYWDIIYLENCGIIGNNPEILKVGMKLVIP